MAPRLIALDGAQGETGGQVVRTALALSIATGQGFTIDRIRPRRVRPGLLAAHVDAIRAAALVCGARVGGAFEGSPDIRFEPGAVVGGEFRFEISSPGPVTLLLQTVLPPLGTAAARSQIEVTGATHAPQSPSFEYLSRHWGPLVERLELRTRFGLRRAGFGRIGGGAVWGSVGPWSRPATLSLEDRGTLVEVRGVTGAIRTKDDAAARMQRGAQGRLWEARRIESHWETASFSTASPGAFVFLEALFERGRAAFGLVGQRRLRPEILGDRVAVALLSFLDSEGAVDPYLIDQLVVPVALANGGGLVTTSEVTDHLVSAVETASAFGVPIRTWGSRGAPGGFAVERS